MPSKSTLIETNFSPRIFLRPNWTSEEWGRMEDAIGVSLESARSFILDRTELLLIELEHLEGVPSPKRLIKLNSKVAEHADAIIKVVMDELRPATSIDRSGVAVFYKSGHLIDITGHLYGELLDAVRALSRECKEQIEWASSAPTMTPQKGNAWRRAVKDICEAFKRLGLPVGVGKDPDNCSSRFAGFIEEWQNLLPADARRAKGSPTALRTEIGRAISTYTPPLFYNIDGSPIGGRSSTTSTKKAKRRSKSAAVPAGRAE